MGLPYNDEYPANEIAAGQLDRILNDPYTQYAIKLNELFQNEFLAKEEELKKFLDILPDETADEREKLEYLLQNPEYIVNAEFTGDFDSLVWAAGLGHLALKDRDNSLRSHPIWVTIKDNPQIAESLCSMARFIDMSAVNRETTMDWGIPGSWFAYYPDRNHINIDLFNTLLCGFSENPAPGVKGFPHACFLMLHEIGHSQLSMRFTNKMIELKNREMEILGLCEHDKKNMSPEKFNELYRKKQEQLPSKKIKELNRVKAEHFMRMSYSFCPVEDNCVNQYALDTGHELSRDMTDSYNICIIILLIPGILDKNKNDVSDSSEDYFITQIINSNIFDADKVAEIKEARKKLLQFQHTTILAFAVKTGLLEITDKRTWKRFGISPGEIKGISTQDDFDRLIDANIGKEGMANLQPRHKGSWLLGKTFARSVENYSDMRCAVIDELWEHYAGWHAKVLLDAAEKMPSLAVSSDKNESNSKTAGNVKPLPSTPKESRNQGKNKGKDSIDPDKASKVRDLAEKDSNANPGPAKGAPDERSGGSGKNVNFAKLAKGDWRQYRVRINELEPTIKRISDDFAFIRNSQCQKVRKISGKAQELPSSLDLKLLDRRKHLEKQMKRKAGQVLQKEDRAVWYREELQKEPTNTTLWILCDGSSSMLSALPGGTLRIESANQSTAVLSEAGKRSNFEVFASVWGDDSFNLIAAPGFTEQEIGENFEKARQGIGSSTKLSPTFTRAIEHCSKQKTDIRGKPKQYSGMTHFLIIGDNGLDKEDIKPLVNMISALFRSGAPVSIDIAVLGTSHEKHMEHVVSEVKREVPTARIGVIKADSAKDVPLLLTGRIKQRFGRSASDFTAIPDSDKRKAFLRAYKAIMGKKQSPGPETARNGLT
jgi:hypothetical protein